MDDRYRATVWRKKLERGRNGWRRFTATSLPRCVIEFHIIHQGYLYSGRHGTFSFDPEEGRTPGTVAYVLNRRDLMTEGVWRMARNPSGEWGMVRRKW
jgi:hypothetical protein